MKAIPASVVIVRIRRGWIAHVRYENRFLDQDIAAGSRHALYTKVEYLFRDHVGGHY